MARKKKTRTVEDIIEDIRELHEKEEDLLMELEDLTQESDIDEGDEYWKLNLTQMLKLKQEILVQHLMANSQIRKLKI